VLRKKYPELDIEVKERRSDAFNIPSVLLGFFKLVTECLSLTVSV
jgi:hypothetical protein